MITYLWLLEVWRKYQWKVFLTINLYLKERIMLKGLGGVIM